jgi:small subunit ribosomal protein S21
VILVPGVQLREGESFEQLLKRFKKQSEKAGILSEVRKRRTFEKSNIAKKKKSIAARKRLMKKNKRR